MLQGIGILVIAVDEYPVNKKETEKQEYNIIYFSHKKLSLRDFTFLADRRDRTGGIQYKCSS